MVFKVGIAADPDDRYHNPEFGYVMEGIWQFMEVLLLDAASECRQVEMDLIETLKSTPGCYNDKPGRELCKSVALARLLLLRGIRTCGPWCQPGQGA